MKERIERQGPGLVVGAGIMLVGIVAGALLFGEGGPRAYGQSATPKLSLNLPAITMAPNEVALISDQAGRYMLLDTRGNVAPIRIKDTALRDSPGEMFVRVP